MDEHPALSDDLMWAYLYEGPRDARARRGVGVDAKRFVARSLFSTFFRDHDIPTGRSFRMLASYEYHHFVRNLKERLVLLFMKKRSLYLRT